MKSKTCVILIFQTEVQKISTNGIENTCNLHLLVYHHWVYILMLEKRRMQVKQTLMDQLNDQNCPLTSQILLLSVPDQHKETRVYHPQQSKLVTLYPLFPVQESENGTIYTGLLIQTNLETYLEEVRYMFTFKFVLAFSAFMIITKNHICYFKLAICLLFRIIAQLS